MLTCSVKVNARGKTKVQGLEISNCYWPVKKSGEYRQHTSERRLDAGWSALGITQVLVTSCGLKHAHRCWDAGYRR